MIVVYDKVYVVNGILTNVPNLVNNYCKELTELGIKYVFYNPIIPRTRGEPMSNAIYINVDCAHGATIHKRYVLKSLKYKVASVSCAFFDMDEAIVTDDDGIVLGYNRSRNAFVVSIDSFKDFDKIIEWMKLMKNGRTIDVVKEIANEFVIEEKLCRRQLCCVDIDATVDIEDDRMYITAKNVVVDNIVKLSERIEMLGDEIVRIEATIKTNDGELAINFMPTQSVRIDMNAVNCKLISRVVDLATRMVIEVTRTTT